MGGKIIPVYVIPGKKPEVPFIISLYIVDLHEGIDHAHQLLPFVVESEETILPARPQRSVPIAEKTVDHIAAYSAVIKREQLEMIAVEPVESFLSAKPKETIFVLCSAIDSAVREAVLYLEVPEIIRLCVCPEQG